MSKKVDGFPDKYYTKMKAMVVLSAWICKTINDVVNGIYDVIDDINQNVCTFGDLKIPLLRIVRVLLICFSNKADKLALAEEIERAKVQKANSDAIQERVTRATTKENELKGSIDTLSTTVDLKEKGLSDRIDALGNDIYLVFVDTEGKIQAQKEKILIMRS